MKDNQNENIIPFLTPGVAKYSSEKIKEGLKLANLLLRISLKQYHCIYVEHGKSTQVDLNYVSTNTKKTQAIWGDKKDIAITSDGSIVVSINNWGAVEVKNVRQQKKIYDIKIDYLERAWNILDGLYVWSFQEDGKFSLKIINNDCYLLISNDFETNIYDLLSGRLINN